MGENENRNYDNNIKLENMLKHAISCRTHTRESKLVRITYIYEDVASKKNIT